MHFIFILNCIEKNEFNFYIKLKTKIEFIFKLILILKKSPFFMPKVFILNLFFDFIFIQKKKVFVLNKYFDKMSIIIVLKLFLLERIFK